MFLFLVPAAAIAAFIAFYRADSLRPSRRALWWVAGVAAAISVLGVFPLLGIPGALLYELCDPWIREVRGPAYRELGEATWPVAILLTLSWPSSLVLAYTAAAGPLRRFPRWLKALVWLAVPVAAAAGLSFLASLMA